MTGTEGSDEGETQHRNQRLSVLLQHITDQIDSLFQQLPILREPPLESRGVSDLDGAEGRTYSDKVASWVNDEEEEENHAGLDLEHQRTESPEPTDEERGRPRRQTLFADEQGQAWPLFQSPPASIGGSEGTTEPEPAESSESRFKVPDRAEEGVWGYLFMLYSDELGTRPIPLRWRDSENREGIALPLEKSAEQGLERNCTGDGLPQGGYLIGRHPECGKCHQQGRRFTEANDSDIVIADPTISNRHCLIFNKSKDDQMVAVVMDMSSNGTFVNETSLGRNQQRDLEDKDEISITSKHRFVFRYSENLQNRGGVFSQQYTVLHKVGKGHFAEVYLCVEKATGSRYAVKIIQRDNNTKMDELDAEMAILNSLNHPNVQHTKASFVEARAVYLVMEYAGQGELFDHIVKKTKLSEAETRALFRQLFKAVEYLVSWMSLGMRVKN